MKNKPWLITVYWIGALTILLVWYWLFNDNTLVKTAVGVLGILSTAACYFKPEWFPNRGTLLIKKLPDGLHHAIRKYSCLVLLVASIYILMGYRVESYRTFGMAALVVLTPLFFIYLFALIKFNTEELPRGLVVLCLCILITLLGFDVIFITVKWEEKISLFEEGSPWPMIVVFFVLYVIQAIVYRRRESGRIA